MHRALKERVWSGIGLPDLLIRRSILLKASPPPTFGSLIPRVPLGTTVKLLPGEDGLPLELSFRLSCAAAPRRKWPMTDQDWAALEPQL